MVDVLFFTTVLTIVALSYLKGRYDAKQSHNTDILTKSVETTIAQLYAEGYLKIDIIDGEEYLVKWEDSQNGKKISSKKEDKKDFL